MSWHRATWICVGFSTALGCVERPYCTPGEALACARDDGAESVSVCDGSGLAFGPCGATGTGGRSSSGVGATGGTGATSGARGPAGTGGTTGTGGTGGTTGTGGTGGTGDAEWIPPECAACMQEHCSGEEAACIADCDLARACLASNAVPTHCPGPRCALWCDEKHGSTGKLVALESCKESHCTAHCPTIGSCGVASTYSAVAVWAGEDVAVGEAVLTSCCAQGLACGLDPECVRFVAAWSRDPPTPAACAGQAAMTTCANAVVTMGMFPVCGSE